MISWTTIVYGAVVSGLLAAVLIAVVTDERRPAVLALAAGTAAVAAAIWNAVLHATHASQFFTDAPLPIFPVSWQDTGSGVWVLAALTLVLSLGPLRRAPAWRAASLATLGAVAALFVDVYLY